MKKLFTTTLLILFVFCVSKQALAQQIIAKSPSKPLADRAVSSSRNTQSVSPFTQQSAARNVNPKNEVQSIFDVQFNYPLSFSAGVSCVYTGTEFWVGRWNVDSLYTLDPLGNITAAFKITGVGAAGSGVRSLTYDGTYIYASVNTTAIKKIDPATKTLVGTITAPTAVRGLAYDSTADSGAGGFWISNFNTDFTLINMTGVTLDAITLAEHGVPGVYGISFDPYTSGGPYIWAYGQGTAGDSAKLVRINAATHMPTGVIHNTWADVAATTAIAGGVSVTWRYDPMHYTLMGCFQDATNNLFGYELADYTPPAIDASCDKVDFFPPFLQTPTFEIAPLTWDLHVANNGSSTITDLSTTFVLNDGTVDVFAPATSHSPGFTPGSSTTLSFGSYTPPASVASYSATGSVNTNTQTDLDVSNDVYTYNMFITDTVMARDNNNPSSALGLPDGNAGVLGQVFDLPVSAYASSATFLLRTPVEGDSVNVDLYTYSASAPGTVIASTGYYVITAADTNGVVITLTFNGGPVHLTPGSYFLGVNQTNFNISLGTSGFNWRPESAYFQFAGAGWTAVELNNGGANPFIICYILRLNLQDQSIMVAEVDNRKFSVYPNPATSQITIESLQGKSDYKVELYDMIGSKVTETIGTVTAKATLDVSKLAKGMYVVKTIVDGKSVSTKVSVN